MNWDQILQIVITASTIIGNVAFYILHKRLPVNPAKLERKAKKIAFKIEKLKRKVGSENV